MKVKTVSQSLAMIVAFTFMSAAAWATHQAFMLSNSGQACSVGNPTPSDSLDYQPGVANKSTTDGVWLVCPVNLSGQFNGANGGSTVQVHATVPATEAEVIVVDSSPTESVQCQAMATSATQGQFFSDLKSTPVGTGSQLLNLASFAGWGGTGGQALGTALMNLAIRSLEYDCFLPKATSSSGGRSSISGYRARICANHSLCSP